jgi:hypothetical protein
MSSMNYSFPIHKIDNSASYLTFEFTCTNELSLQDHNFLIISSGDILPNTFSVSFGCFTVLIVSNLAVRAYRWMCSIQQDRVVQE